jgi:cupin 2 domain-containing protein
MAAGGRRGARSGVPVTPPANLLRDLPDAQAAETIDAIVTMPALRIERIVSQGQASPPGFWYDQPEGEWVLLLAGAARLRFADEDADRVLGPGDWVHIAAHRHHRVEWTDPATPTLWLAVFYGDCGAAAMRPGNAVPATGRRRYW